MRRFRRSTPPVSHHLEVGETRIPVYVIVEGRKDCRVSIGKTGIRVRVSSWLSKEERERQVRDLLGWAERKICDNGWKHEEPRRIYRPGEVLALNGSFYRIDVEPGSAGAVEATIQPGRIGFRVGPDLRVEERTEGMSEAAAGAARRYFLPEVAQRVDELNERHFGRPYDRIRLKHNRSNWGSCSVQGNLNLNVRLLLAPPAVFDYVIVHELAHLVEHNHGPRFWKLVRGAMPGCKKHVEWLRRNGERCVF